MKTKKRRLEYYSFYDHTGIEQHLTEMAKKGWLLESISNLYWTYRKIEPRDTHFCVTYYPRASDFDSGPSEDQQTFHDLCAHTGWQLACTWHQMQVFYNEKESPIPLDTDPIMEVDTLHRACKKNFLPSYYLLLALGVLMGGYFLAEIYFAPVTLLSNSSQMLSGFAYLCVLVISLTELCTYFSWYRKAKRAAQDDIFVDTPSTKLIQQTVVIVLLFAAAIWILNLFTLSNRMLAWIAVAMLICMFAIIFAVNWIKHGLRKLKASRGLNRILTLTACLILPTVMMGGITYATLSGIFSNENQNVPFDDSVIPLSITDFYDVDKQKYIEQNRNNETFVLGQRVVHMFGDWNVEGFHELPDLQYTITTVKIPFIYEWCKDQMYWDLDESDNKDIPVGHRLVLKEQDPSPWGANEVYRLYQEEGWYMNWYLLCYEDRIIDIRFDWEPTTDDMAIVNQKLNP